MGFRVSGGEGKEREGGKGIRAKERKARDPRQRATAERAFMYRIIKHKTLETLTTNYERPDV